MAALLPAFSVPREADLSFGLPGVLFALGLAMLCTLALTLVATVNLFRAADPPRIPRYIWTDYPLLHDTLAVGQIAITFLLFTSCILAARTYLRIRSTQLGYEPAQVRLLELPMDGTAYPDWSARSQYLERLLAAVKAVPQVPDAAIAFHATPPNSGWLSSVTLAGDLGSTKQVYAHFVSSDYFSVLRTPLLTGSTWSDAAESEGMPLAIINQKMERDFFGYQNPIGQIIRIPPWSYLQYTMRPVAEGTAVRIIGVVADFRNDGPDRSIGPQLYLPFSNLMGRQTQILFRVSGFNPSLARDILKNIQAVEPAQQAYLEPSDLDSLLKLDLGWARARLLGQQPSTWLWSPCFLRSCACGEP